MVFIRGILALLFAVGCFYMANKLQEKRINDILDRREAKKKEEE